MAQHPIKTTSGAPDRGLLAQTDYVDPSGNLWVTGAVTVGGIVTVTPSGVFAVSISGIAAADLTRVGGSALALGQRAASSSLPVVIASDQGGLTLALPSLATAPQNATSTAYEASHQIKGGPGVLLGLSGYSSKVSAQFILLINSGSAGVPPEGAVPAVIISVAAGSNFSYDPGSSGRAFSAGIWVLNSSTGPTKTIGSADCWFDAQFV